MSSEEALAAIYDDYTNGNRCDMVGKIDAYGLYDFWEDMRDYLRASTGLDDDELASIQMHNICVIYHRIKYR